MSANVENMFSVKSTPWHGLGHVLQQAPNSLEAIKLAGLDWPVECVKVFGPEQEEIEGWRSVRRATDHTHYGIVSDRWAPLQNSEAFAFFDPIVEAGEATYETAGALKNGRVVWILAKLNRAPVEVAPGDVVERYVLLSNGHGGSMACRLGFTPIRVVCSNTLAGAHTADDSELVRLRHSSRIVENLQALRETLNLIDAKFEASAEQYKTLARRQINSADLKKYINVVFDRAATTMPPADDDGSGMKPIRASIVQRITDLFENGRGTDIASTRGTWWTAYNAVNEYLGYDRGANQDNRVHSMWYGDGAEQNEKALEVAYQYVYNVLQ